MIITIKMKNILKVCAGVEEIGQKIKKIKKYKKNNIKIKKN